MIGEEGKFKITSSDQEIDPLNFKSYEVPENTTELAICVSRFSKNHQLARFIYKFVFVDSTEQMGHPMIVDDDLKAKIGSKATYKIPLYVTDTDNTFLSAIDSDFKR